MDKKEKEILAILGLVLSLLIWGTVFYNTLKSQVNLIRSAQNVQVTKPALIAPSPSYSEDDIRLMKEAKLYSDKIVDSLVLNSNYEFVYQCFDKDVKEKCFNNDINKCQNDLNNMFGKLGTANNFSFANQVVSRNKDIITCYYSVTYKKNFINIMTVIQVYLKVSNNNFALNGLQQQPIK